MARRTGTRAMVGVVLGLLLAPTVDAAPSPASCSMIGATYIARSTVASNGVAYRLKIELLPPTAQGAAVATLWRFQAVSATGGRNLSELRMRYECANGRGPCSVSPSSRPGPAGGLYSEVVQLNRDFTLATGSDAPYAIILPGFGQDNWTFTRRDLAMPDLTFFTPDKVTPDLADRQIWILSACGPSGWAGQTTVPLRGATRTRALPGQTQPLPVVAR